MYPHSDILKRYLNTYRKINSLTTIRNILSLDKSTDLTSKQWNSIETLLFAIKKDLSLSLKSTLKLNLNDPKSIKKFNNIVVGTEMRLNRAVKIFDTYLDIISQRQSRFLGRMLGGCDVFASAAIRQKHPILHLVETPIIYLQKDYSAAIIKENADFYGYKTPGPLIQIPYSMLVASYMLTSIAHESGHAVMPHLRLDTVFPKMVFKILDEAGTPTYIKDLFVLWNRELFADLWAFFCCGKAQAGIRDLLALSDEIVYDIRLNDPHPTNQIRVLLSFEWCRIFWGNGRWDEWEDEWLKLYPIKSPLQKNAKTLEEIRQFVPIFSSGVMKAIIPNLKMRFIDLFDMTNLNPSNLKKIAEDPDRFRYGLKKLNPCHQFAVIRHMYDENLITGRLCNRLVHKWLRKLNECKMTVFDI
jgi:hypothetical protein